MASTLPVKRPRAADGELQALGIDGDDWDSLRASYKQYDDNREIVIKKCRDVQKLAKQAVYSVIRGDLERAGSQLSGAEAAAREVLPLIEAAPGLRAGAYSNAMEEYAEAQVLKLYVESGGRIPARHALPLAVTVDEYLGGVLDFTGELNRLAVAKATDRDKAGVQQCHDTVMELQEAILGLELGASLQKKLGPLRGTAAKLAQALYELSLTEGTLLAASGSGLGAADEPPDAL